MSIVFPPRPRPTSGAAAQQKCHRIWSRTAFQFQELEKFDAQKLSVNLAHACYYSFTSSNLCPSVCTAQFMDSRTPRYKPPNVLGFSPWRALQTLCILDTSSSAQATGLCSTHGTGARTAASQLLRPPCTVPGIDTDVQISIHNRIFLHQFLWLWTWEDWIKLNP